MSGVRQSPDWIRRGWMAAALAGLALSAALFAQNRKWAGAVRSLEARIAAGANEASKPAAPAVPPPTDSMRRVLIGLALHGDPAARLKQLRDMGVRIQFEDFLALGQSLPSPWREQALWTLVLEWSPEDRLKALTWAAALPEGQARNSTLQSLANAAQKDPEFIIGWLSRLPESPGRSSALMNAIRQAAQTNPARAAQWLDSLGPGQPMIQAMIPEVVSQWVRKDAAAATAWAGRLAKGPIRDQAYMQVANALAASSPELALSWGRAIESDGMRQSAVSEVLAQWAVRDPGTAARHLAELPPGPGYDMAAMRFAGSLAGQRPEEAVLLLDTISNNDLRRSASYMVLSQWANRDPNAAGAYALRMSEGPERDQIFHLLAIHTRNRDPKAAETWAASIQNPEMRDKTLQVLQQQGWDRGQNRVPR